MNQSQSGYTFMHIISSVTKLNRNFLTSFSSIKDVERVKLLKVREHGANTQITMASKSLKRKMQTLQHVARSPNAVNMESLNDVAVIRAALEALSTHLSDEFDENMKRFEALPTCLEAAKHLCSDPSRSAMQLFLLKQLVRHDPNGFDAVKERCKREELKWIMPTQAEVKRNIFIPVKV